MINAALCGFGALGHVHADSLAGFDDVCVKAVCDINPDTLTRQQVAFNIDAGECKFNIAGSKTYTDFAMMLETEELDVVVLAIPTDIHAKYAMMAMEKGISVFSEKPMSHTVENCQQMIACRNKNGVQLMVGQCLRFWGEYEYLKASIEDNRYGKLRSLHMERMGNSTGLSDWYLDHHRSGGALLDLHVHDVDWVNSVFGVPEQIQAMGRVGATGGIDDLISMWKYGQTTVSLVGSWMYDGPFTMRYRAMFDDATLEYSIATNPTLVEYRIGQEPKKIEVDTNSAYTRELRYFMDCVKNGQPNTVTPAESTCVSIELALKEQQIINAQLGTGA